MVLIKNRLNGPILSSLLGLSLFLLSFVMRADGAYMPMAGNYFIKKNSAQTC